MNTSLTSFELELVQDAEILITKNKILQKVNEMFGCLAVDYENEVRHKLQLKEVTINAKISRGENYKGLPYIMLDYPREFSKQDIFAIRTFFWWGNFFSITLHLSGKFQNEKAAVLQKAVEAKMFDGWYLNAGPGQWEHHFNQDNYTFINGQYEATLAELPFIKLAKKIPLDQWDKASELFIDSFKFLTEMLEV